MPLFLVAVLGLIGDAIVIMESSGYLLLMWTDPLQLDLEAVTMSLEDRFEELVPFRRTYRSAAYIRGLHLPHPEQ